jgi:hypothetical protein
VTAAPRPLLKLIQPSRATDDQAIEALCFFLDRMEVGKRSGLGSRSGLDGTHGELWSTVLRRRMRDTYRATGTAAQYMHRHFHFRRAMLHETDEQSAAHVGKVWGRAEATISTHALRKRERARAMRWVEKALESLRRGPKPLPETLVVDTLEDLMRQKAAEFSGRKKVKRTTAKPR